MPGGLLVSADIASPEPIESAASALDLWMRAMQYAGMSEDMALSYRKRLGTGVAVLSPAEISAIHIEAGFGTSRLISQNLLMYSWLAQRTA